METPQLDNTEDTGQPGARSLRGYQGIRITAPPRAVVPDDSAVIAQADETPLTREQQARILTGASLMGALLVVLAHELGHWLAGLAVTGMAPDFYVFAVRQKTAAISNAEGVLIWGAGPAAQLAALWALTLIAPLSGRYAARLAAGAGAAIVFSIALTSIAWALAVFSSPEQWQDDLPKVASFFPSAPWAVMWLLNAAFITALAVTWLRWLKMMKNGLNRRMFAGPIAVGAIQGGVIVLVGSIIVSLAI